MASSLPKDINRVLLVLPPNRQGDGKPSKTRGILLPQGTDLTRKIVLVHGKGEKQSLVIPQNKVTQQLMKTEQNDPVLPQNISVDAKHMPAIQQSKSTSSVSLPPDANSSSLMQNLVVHHNTETTFDHSNLSQPTVERAQHNTDGSSSTATTTNEASTAAAQLMDVKTINAEDLQQLHAGGDTITAAATSHDEPPPLHYTATVSQQDVVWQPDADNLVMEQDATAMEEVITGDLIDDMDAPPGADRPMFHGLKRLKEIFHYITKHTYHPATRERAKSAIRHTARKFRRHKGTWLYIGKGIKRAKHVPTTVEDCQEILRRFHDHDGHTGQKLTHKKIAQYFYWPNFSGDIMRWVIECEHCQIKSKRTRLVPPQEDEGDWYPDVPDVQAIFSGEVAAEPVHTQSPTRRRSNTLDSEKVSRLLGRCITQGFLHRCEYCDILFPDFNMYVLHAGTHATFGDSPFQCQFCKVTFANKFDFMTHFVQCVHHG